MSTGRRLALARWPIPPEYPLTARVMVNRMWAGHFGTGIVKIVGNFGHAGSGPSNQALLDWLATEFVQPGWSTEAIHRLEMTSDSYRQSSRVTSEQEKSDPQNKFFSRMPLRRMEAEVLNDTMILIAGRLGERRFGTPDPVMPGMTVWWTRSKAKMAGGAVSICSSGVRKHPLSSKASTIRN